jgi:hypothetical protein
VVHNLVHLTGRALQYGGYRKQAFPRNSYVTYTIYVIFRLPQIVCKCICRRDVKAVRDIHSNIRWIVINNNTSNVFWIISLVNYF